MLATKSKPIVTQESDEPEAKIAEMTHELEGIDKILASLERVKERGILSRLWDWLFGNEKELKAIVDDGRYKCDLLCCMSAQDIKLVDIALLDVVKKLIEYRKGHNILYCHTAWPDYLYFGDYDHDIYFDRILKRFSNSQIRGFLKLKYTKVYKFLIDNNWTIKEADCSYLDRETDVYLKRKGYFLSYKVFCFEPGKHEESV